MANKDLSQLSENSKYHSKAFDDLSEGDQIKLKDSVLRTFIIQQLKPEDDSSIYHVFERLNTGGTFLNNQEVRNCVYYGKLNELIRTKLNLNKDFREIIGKPEPDKRMGDNELILRFLSFTGDLSNYSKPLKDYMSRYFKRHRNPSDEFMEATENTFNRTCRIVIEVLGPKPFHVKRGLNVAVYDSVMTAFASNASAFSDGINKEIIENYRSKYDELVKALDENNLISGATTDEEPVRKRFNLAEQILFDKRV